MTKTLFYNDAYLKERQTKVVRIEGNKVLEVIEKALGQANKNIRKGLEIKTYEDETRKGFRWCQVGNYNPIPCGGLHVKNTKEIGGIILKEKIIENGKQKIAIGIK